jgi:hypothetical protein
VRFAAKFACSTGLLAVSNSRPIGSRCNLLQDAVLAVQSHDVKVLTCLPRKTGSPNCETHTHKYYSTRLRYSLIASDKPNIFAQYVCTRACMRVCVCVCINMAEG